MTTDYLIDTTIWVDFLRGFRPAIKFLKIIDPILISIVTQAELIEGCRNSDELTKVQGVFQKDQVIPLMASISVRAIDILEKHFLKSGILFDDALIAATAMGFDLTLATTEKKHLRSIKGLSLHKPY